MRQIWNSLRLAFSMYSIIPARQVEKNKENMKYILIFVPWVGAVIGFLITKWRIASPYLFDYEFLRSVICVMISIFLSSGAFLDGFFRTVDALSSHQPMEGKLEILKDSHGGYFAIITCVCYFMLIVGLWSEMPIDVWPVVAYGFVISRALYGLSIVWFRHSSESKCTLYVPEGNTRYVIAGVMLFYIVICAYMMIHIDLYVGLGCLGGTLISFLFYCWVAFRHFGGITEDIASFFVQVCEIVIPLAAWLVCRMPTDFASL